MVRSRRGFYVWKVTDPGILGHVWKITKYDQMTAATAAATAAAATSQELYVFDRALAVSRPGIKYPVRGNPSLRQKHNQFVTHDCRKIENSLT